MKRSFLYSIMICFFYTSAMDHLEAQCTGIDADAGADIIICDPTQIIQLNGQVSGNYTKFFWTPAVGLNNPNILDPIVTFKNPGKYTFKLTAEGLSSVNLIINGDFESGNTGFSTAYTYNSQNTTEGEYIVTSNPSGWNPGFSSCGDHTTGSGNMLLLNGHPIAGTNCWCQTVTTVIGRTYQFEFWSTSVVAFNIGQLNVKLNGNSIGTTTAGGLCDWQQFIVSFVATSTTTQLCISETSGIRGGNDFALDDIALYEKCIDMDEMMLEIVNLVAKINIPSLPKCSSDIFDLTGIGSSFGPNISYKWSTDIGKIISSTGVTAKGRGSGIYTLTVIYTNGAFSCEAEASIEIITPDVLAGNINGVSKVNCKKDSILITVNMNTGSGLYSYAWEPDSLILKGRNSDSVYIQLAGKYKVTVTDQTSGCTLLLDYEIKADTTKPNAEITGDSLLDCRKSFVFLKSNQKDSLRYTQRWINPDQNILQNKTSIKDSLKGNYILIVQDTLNFCSDSTHWMVNIDTLHPKIELGNNLDIDCRNKGVVISNQRTNDSLILSYFWTVDSIQLPKEKTANDKFIINSAWVYLRLQNDINGCESKDSIFITDSRMIPFLDAGNNDILNCKMNQIQLNAKLNPMDSLFIKWSSPTGNFLSGIDSSDVIINKKGWYFIHIINQINGCENIDSVYVDENKNLPDAILGPDLIFSCKDTIKIIDGSLSSSGNQFLYDWSSVDGIIKSGLGTHSLEVTSPGTYQLIVLDKLNGCSDTASVIIKADLNKPILNISKPDTLNCIFTEVLLSATATSQTGNTLDLLWTNNSGAWIESPDSLQTKISSPGIYTFNAIDPSNGCSTSLQTQVYIDTLRPLIDAGSDKIWNCASTQLNASANILNNTRSYLYQWATSNGNIIGSTRQKDILISSPGRYYLIIYDARNSCSAIDSLDVIPDLVKPIIQIQNPDTLNCLQTQIPLDAQGSSTGNRFIVSWTSTNGNIIGNPALHSILIDKPGSYRFFILDTVNKCSRIDSVIVFEDKIIPGINIEKPLEIHCTRKVITLNASINNVGSNYLANWTSLNGNIISSGMGLQCLVDKSGRYILRIRNLQNGCENTDTIVIIENTNLPTDFNFVVQHPRCTGDKGSIDILSIVGGEKPFSYFVDNVLTDSAFIQNLSSGLKNIRIVDVNGCIFSKDILINPATPIAVNLPPTVKLNFGDDYVIKPIFSIPIDSIDWIIWTPSDHLSCDDCPEPTIINLDKETTYQIRYANKHGCEATATILIQILKRGIWIPNVFSPNGDNINDYFYPVLAEDSYNEIRSMSIYNRWGEQVFYKQNFLPNDPREGWNGEFNQKKLNPAVFVYMIEVEWKNGEVEKVFGDLSLIR